MEDVRAATISARKKSIATKAPRDMFENMNGNVSKTRLGPSSGSSPKANTAGIMAQLASNANMVSEMAVYEDEAAMFSFLLTYEPYVSIVPIPREREKKAWPRAAEHTDASIFEKSGLKRYASPSAAPGSVTARTAMMTMRTKSIGIITLPNFSIPLFTPEMTIRAVISRKMVCPISGAHTEDVKLLNKVPSCDCVMPSVNSNVTDLKKYSTPQPPTTL